MKELALFAGIFALILVIQIPGKMIAAKHTIAVTSFTVDGRTVSVRVMDDRSIVYEPKLFARERVFEENGSLTAQEVISLVGRSYVAEGLPTIEEEELWYRYFGAQTRPSLPCRH